MKARLDHHRDGRPWNQFLEQLRKEHADPITFNDAEAIAETVSDRVKDEFGLTDFAEMYEDVEEPPPQPAEPVAASGEQDTDEIAEAVARKLDYAQLANAVADELEGRMA